MPLLFLGDLVSAIMFSEGYDMSVYMVVARNSEMRFR